MQWLKKRWGSVVVVRVDLPPDLTKIHQESWDAHIWVYPWGGFQRLIGSQRTEWVRPALRGVPSDKLAAQLIWESREGKPALASVSFPWVWSSAADSGGHQGFRPWTQTCSSGSQGPFRPSPSDWVYTTGSSICAFKASCSEFPIWLPNSPTYRGSVWSQRVLQAI